MAQDVQPLMWSKLCRFTLLLLYLLKRTLPGAVFVAGLSFQKTFQGRNYEEILAFS